MVEHFLGKEEVTSSILVNSSRSESTFRGAFSFGGYIRFTPTLFSDLAISRVVSEAPPSGGGTPGAVIDAALGREAQTG